MPWQGISLGTVTLPVKWSSVLPPGPSLWSTSWVLGPRVCSAAISDYARSLTPKYVGMAPYLAHHGLGKDLCPAWPAQHVGCFEEDLGTVSDWLQVPFLPGGQRSLYSLVEQVLRKEEVGGLFLAQGVSQEQRVGCCLPPRDTQGGLSTTPHS